LVESTVMSQNISLVAPPAPWSTPSVDRLPLVVYLMTMASFATPAVVTQPPA